MSATHPTQVAGLGFLSSRGYLQEIEWLLTETEELLSIALGIQTQAEEAAVREPLDQAAVLLRPKPASKASVEVLEKLVFDGEVDYQCVLSHTCPVCRFKLPTE
ncbi:hypothetical protein L3X38_028086 [Prunus dulcis]|uniref:Uncharacterized protein n=1 Tax=Prunus dulcis TaxID=3755 RepID=A0AAD4Z139_PRUDU|nr:hypothetical protein L3X38_028086 [Prunus dulcis]